MRLRSRVNGSLAIARCADLRKRHSAESETRRTPGDSGYHETVTCLCKDRQWRLAEIVISEFRDCSSDSLCRIEQLWMLQTPAELTGAYPVFAPSLALYGVANRRGMQKPHP